MRLGAVLLAAGRGERFGGNKLLVDYGGRSMISCAIDAMRFCGAQRFAAVVSCSETADIAKACGLEVIWNGSPEKGQSYSICLGVSAMLEMDAVLLMAADQPRLTGASLARLADQYRHSGRGLACLCDETHRGNPAVFSSAYYQKLLSLSGDRGAKGILRAHEDDLLVVSCLNPHELADADTRGALADIAELG